MEQGRMKRIKAAIFDVYGTLLEVGSPPADADARWKRLFEEMLDTAPSLTRTEFSVRINRVIARHHGEAKARGIRWPEIGWSAVVQEVLPDLATLSPKQQPAFLLRQMGIGRSLRLAEHAGDCLKHIRNSRRLLGIASNSQAYTLQELDSLLRPVRLRLSHFDEHLRFWSFEHGFSKPDPHVFRILTTRLEARGIKPVETLMVGDRADNDIEPAREHGWQTWLLTLRKKGDGRTGGNWEQLQAALE
jgi:FMN phosphatase YigB (HAD superfamily)